MADCLSRMQTPAVQKRKDAKGDDPMRVERQHN